jgi:hypothetical protein
MQKVITVMLDSLPTKSNECFSEFEHPLLNKYLEDGFIVKNIVPLNLSDKFAYFAFVVTIEK